MSAERRGILSTYTNRSSERWQHYGGGNFEHHAIYHFVIYHFFIYLTIYSFSPAKVLLFFDICKKKAKNRSEGAIFANTPPKSKKKMYKPKIKRPEGRFILSVIAFIRCRSQRLLI